MKYIRTKDGIVDLTKKEDVDTNARGDITFYDPKKDTYYLINYDSIVNQVDTIEELCDEFVVAYKNGSKIVYSDLEWAKDKANMSLTVGMKSIIYGAIWTDEGLIYVAKLNKKGELELL